MSRERAEQTCMEMLSQRGYTDISKEGDEYFLALKPDGNQVALIFYDLAKFDTKGMKETISLMNEIEVNHIIVVYKEDVTPATKKTLLSHSEDRQFELFAEEDLQYNITNHRLQPKFERLSQNDTEQFIKNYGIKFGTLRIDRPISRFYNYKRGDVIRITRSCGYVNYRIVR